MQYHFRDPARSTLTDPGGDGANVAANEPWPSVLSLPSLETELRQASSDGSIPLTFYIYERDQWKVANVLSVDPSEPSSLEKTVWVQATGNVFE